MAKVGRPRKPTALKVLEGNPGKRPLPESEPRPDALQSPQTPPRTLTPGAAAEWRLIAPGLAGMGLLTTLDQGALETYCELRAIWRRCVMSIESRARLGQKQLAALAAAEADVAKWSEAAEHSDSPEVRSTLNSARARLELAQAAALESDPTGIAHTTMQGKVVSPEARLMSAMATQMIKYASQFGMTPSSRSGLASGDQGRESDPFADAMRG